MAVNDKISKADFNAIQTKLANVIGNGAGNTGWGQTVISSPVNEGYTVGVNDWGKLRYDIVNAYKHIYGSNPSTTQTVVDQLIRSDQDATTFTGAISGNILRVYSVSSGMLAVGQTISGTGVSGSPVITGTASQLPITLSGMVSKTGSSPGPFYVTFSIPAEPVAPQINVDYTVSGNTVSSFNSTVRATASTTTSITLQYPSDPEKLTTATCAPYGMSATTVVVDNIQNIIPGQTISGTGFTSGQTVYSTETQTFYSVNSSIDSSGPADVLTVGTIVSGTIYPGMTITGDNIPPNTYIVSNIAGSGSGSSWTLSTTTLSVANIAIDGSRNVIISNSLPSVTPSGVLTFKFNFSISGVTSLIAASSTNPWGRSSWTLNTSQTLSARTLTSNSTTEYPLSQYDTYANTITNNRFTVHTTQASTYSWPAVSRVWTPPASWTSYLYAVVTATWSTSEAARKFFNSGGLIRFTSSRSGNQSPPQNKSWTDLLAGMGMLVYGGNFPAAGISAMDGKNYFRCTDAWQLSHIVSASTPYTANNFQIYARTPNVPNNSSGTAKTMEFLVYWIDGYVDRVPQTVPQTGYTPPASAFPPYDNVDGTFTLNVSHLYAVGTLDPVGTPNFIVEQPTISITAITGV